MRVDRKIWGPGAWPGARVVVAYPGDDLDEAVLAELLANEPGATAAETVEEGSVEPEPAAEPAPKPRRRRTKKAT